VTEERLIVGHVTWRGTEFGICLDDFVDCLQEIFLGRHFATCSDSKHPGFSTDTSYLGTYRTDTSPTVQLITPIRHLVCNMYVM